jgi:hypothetical protein
MNSHLSPARFAEWISGEHAVESERHLLECPACRSELESFESGLAALGECVRSWATQENAAPDLRIGEQARSVRPAWRWALAGVAIGGMVLLPILRSTQTQRAAALQEDAELLRHIDSQLSRAVPATMEPLMNLMQQRREEEE